MQFTHLVSHLEQQLQQAVAARRQRHARQWVGGRSGCRLLLQPGQQGLHRLAERGRQAQALANRQLHRERSAKLRPSPTVSCKGGAEI